MQSAHVLLRSNSTASISSHSFKALRSNFITVLWATKNKLSKCSLIIFFFFCWPCPPNSAAHFASLQKITALLCLYFTLYILDSNSNISPTSLLCCLIWNISQLHMIHLVYHIYLFAISALFYFSTISCLRGCFNCLLYIDCFSIKPSSALKRE